MLHTEEKEKQSQKNKAQERIHFKRGIDEHMRLEKKKSNTFKSTHQQNLRMNNDKR
jgi:hypothetical protein